MRAGDWTRIGGGGGGRAGHGGRPRPHALHHLGQAFLPELSLALGLLCQLHLLRQKSGE